MKKLFAVATLALAVAGCGIFGDTKPITKDVPATCKTIDPQTKVVTVNAICAAAFEAIDQANVLLRSVDRMVLGKLKAGIWTKAQAQVYYDQTGKLGAKVDEAIAIFSRGDYVSAQAQAAATQQLLLILEKEIAAAAKSAAIDVLELLII